MNLQIPVKSLGLKNPVISNPVFISFIRHDDYKKSENDHETEKTVEKGCIPEISYYQNSKVMSSLYSELTVLCLLQARV